MMKRRWLVMQLRQESPTSTPSYLSYEANEAEFANEAAKYVLTIGLDPKNGTRAIVFALPNIDETLVPAPTWVEYRPTGMMVPYIVPEHAWLAESNPAFADTQETLAGASKP